jgi:O-antigen biosynthesis protein
VSAPPLVSVVIPVLDGARTIESVLTALRAQAGAPPFEIIVADNGSTDGTLAVVTAPDVTVLEEPRRGASIARNRGLREARGAIVAFLDADALPSRRWLAELAAAFDEPTTVIAMGGMSTYPARTPAQRFTARYGLHDPGSEILRGPIPYANTRNMAVRRDAALAIGGFDEAMSTLEDVDFSVRLIRMTKCTIVHRPRAVVLHHDRETDEELRLQALGYGRGMALMYRRYPDLLPWGRRQRVAVVRRIGRRVGLEWVVAIQGRLGRRSADDIEFAHYARRWNWWFWQGFWQGRRRPETDR